MAPVADMSAPPTPIVEMEIPESMRPDGPLKEKRRQRLLRGIQRISSSPSLAQFNRSRSSSSPYGTRGSLSCASLAGTAPPFAAHSSGSVTPGYFSSSSHGSGPSTPSADSSFEAAVPARKIPHSSSAISTPSSVALPAEVTSSRSRSNTALKPLYDFWAGMPHEIRIHVFSYLQPKELVRVSLVSKEFYNFCFDGQLWGRFDATEFYNVISAEALAKIIVRAGPFVKDLNLRGCVQMEHGKQAETVVEACKNLVNATLEGCRNLQRSTLHNLIKNNDQLVSLNLTSLSAVTNSTCKIISQHCPRLEILNVSWCQQMDARGVKMVIAGCPNLKDVRAGEVTEFHRPEVAQAIFRTNKLERLVLNGCTDLTDTALKIMVQGVNPEIDILTDRPVVPARKLRHLDLSRCTALTDASVKTLGYLVPDLEGLQLNCCSSLTDSALEPILASTPRLTHLEIEDLSNLTNDLLSKHLAKAPCAPKLERLSVSYCENFGEVGMLPVMKNCVSLRNVDMDNTKIGDLVLAEAAAMVRQRSRRAAAATREAHREAGNKDRSAPLPIVGLNLVVYDCQMVTWTGIREVLSWNAETRNFTTPAAAAAAGGSEDDGSPPPSQQPPAGGDYPSEIVGLKCYYGWQQTVDHHTNRVLQGNYASAARLERKWVDYMQAFEEAGAGGGGAGRRRRQRRAREAQLLHEQEGGGYVFGGGSRRRARTVAGSCSVM